ncbi:hypothetical protein ACOQFO_09590 [Ureibacillus sp. MALMAid1270]|uniref:hypothetical protein n=1 Tax=Ureibacillus sp. MALMAid1270 TaxID=3411629 RepID=UPI003BA62755
MKRIFLFVFLGVGFILTGCSNDLDNDITNELKIGVIGKIPNIIEDNVEFIPATFNDITANHQYDAFFIMEDSLSEAAEIEKINRFKESKSYIFFVGSKAHYFPFIEHANSVTYEEYSKRINDHQSYISGIRYVNDVGEFVGYTANLQSFNEKDKLEAYLTTFEYINKNK